MKKQILNFALFQIGWFSCVIGAAQGFPLFGPVVVSIVIAIHLALAAQPRRELALIAIAGLLGAMFDTVLVQTGWLVYPNGMLWAGTAPYWIIAMWLLFATTLNVSMRWMHGRPVAAFVLGLVGGPLSYLAGERLGGIELVNQSAALLALAAGWAIVTPILVALSQRLDGIQMQAETGVAHA